MIKIRKELTNKQWKRIKIFFPDKTGQKGRPPKNHRMMLNAILWILRTGARGEIYLLVTALGNLFIAGSEDGPKLNYGMTYLLIFQKTMITNVI